MKKLFTIGIIIFLAFCTAGVAHAEYYVKKGDSLYKIAKDTNMTFKDILSLNPHLVDPNHLKIGQYLVIRTKTEPQKDLVDYARSLQDITHYVYGGSNAPYFTDCSGYVQYVFSKFGYKLPRTSREQSVTGTPIQFKDMHQGDLMFFSNDPSGVITHVGIYMGDNYWISNLNSKSSVKVLSTWGVWSQKHFKWAIRVM